MLAFTKALLHKLGKDPSLSAEVLQSIEAVHRSTEALSAKYAADELGEFLDMSKDNIRDKQGQDLLKHFEASAFKNKPMRSQSSVEPFDQYILISSFMKVNLFICLSGWLCTCLQVLKELKAALEISQGSSKSRGAWCVY